MTRKGTRDTRRDAMRNPTLRARVEQELFDRVKRCADAYNARLRPGARPHDLQDIMRMALLEGLPALERDVGITQPASAPAPAPAERPTPSKPAKKSAVKRTKSG
jgi:hypothetical protein